MDVRREVTVKDIMTKGAVTLGGNDILDLASDIMNLGRLRHLPIVENGKVIGVLSQRDLFHAALIKALGLRHKEEKELLQAIRVAEVMSQPVITIPSKASVKEAARLMVEKKIGCLPVVDAGFFTGLVTETDILRYVAER